MLSHARYRWRICDEISYRRISVIKPRAFCKTSNDPYQYKWVSFVHRTCNRIQNYGRISTSVVFLFLSSFLFLSATNTISCFIFFHLSLFFFFLFLYSLPPPSPSFLFLSLFLLLVVQYTHIHALYRRSYVHTRDNKRMRSTIQNGILSAKIENINFDSATRHVFFQRCTMQRNIPWQATDN